MSSRARTSVSVSDRSYHLKGEALAASDPLPHASLAIALRTARSPSHGLGVQQDKPFKAVRVAEAQDGPPCFIQVLDSSATCCRDIEHPVQMLKHLSGKSRDASHVVPFPFHSLKFYDPSTAFTLLFRQRQWDYKLSTQAMASRE
eukprot:g13702.t1